MSAFVAVGLVTFQCRIAAAAVLVASTSSGQAPDAAPVPDAALLRARAIELVDDEGRPRAQLGVEANGEVMLRLRDPDGAVRVKLGASQAGSGLLAQPGERKITLRAPNGKERVVEP